jgi:hypothetical protein
MKSLNNRAVNIRTIAKTVMVLVLAFVAVGMSITPVLADDGRGDRGREGYRGRDVRHGQEGYHGRRGYDGPRGYYRPAPRYYPPPRVVYAPPPPPPGITFVFPINIR